MRMNKNLFPIICTVLILIGWATGLIYFTSKPEQEQCNQFCEMEDLSLQLRDINYRLDWVEKALVSLQEEKTALLEDREHIITEAQNIYRTLFSNEHWTDSNTEWEPGKLTEDGSHQEMPATTGDDSHERFKQMANAYWLTPGDIREVENHYWLTEWMILCIAISETSGWKKWAGINNVGNVGNTDSNPRGQSYSNLWASLDAIWRTLNNGYLWGHTTLWCLSNAGSCKESSDNWKRYASSDGNRERNMSACLGQIYNKKIDASTFLIRNR